MQGPHKPENLSRAEAFLFCFNRLLQTARIHEGENRLCQEAARAFAEAGGRLLRDQSEITMEARHERLFVQSERLLLKQHTAPVVFSILSLLEGLSLPGLRFHSRLADIQPWQAYEMARLLIEAQAAEDPPATLRESFAEERFQWLEILSEPQARSELTSTQKSELAHKAYSHAYNSIKEVVCEIQANRPAGIRKSLRVVQDITDLVFVDKHILLGISTIRDYDDYTFTHSVNVAIQSICLGHEIGLSRNGLVRLGICGLFHDLGKVAVPIDILNKPGYLNHEEYQTVKQHPINSVRQILKLHAYRDLIAQIILPPFEHHLNYDLSGYPEVEWRRSMSLFGRIIEICDVYDALTAPRIYREAALSQDRALGLMLAKTGQEFDPLLLKWFINMMGIYPVGTLVRLNTGEAGLVCESPEKNGESRQPRVLLIRKAGKKHLKAGPVVDLKEADPASGKPRRRIRSTHNPYQYGIQPAVFLMQA
jgi:HD-GYP domain-containing protein (c-di-GMP phosphodiesterase class II)